MRSLKFSANLLTIQFVRPEETRIDDIRNITEVQFETASPTPPATPPPLIEPWLAKKLLEKSFRPFLFCYPQFTLLSVSNRRDQFSISKSSYFTIYKIFYCFIIISNVESPSSLDLETINRIYPRGDHSARSDSVELKLTKQVVNRSIISIEAPSISINTHLTVTVLPRVEQP